MGSVAIGLTVIRVHMQGYPVDRSANSPLLQFRYELCAINLQPIQLQADRVKVPGMDAVRQLLRKDEFFDLFEQLPCNTANCSKRSKNSRCLETLYRRRFLVLRDHRSRFQIQPDRRRLRYWNPSITQGQSVPSTANGNCLAIPPIARRGRRTRPSSATAGPRPFLAPLLYPPEAGSAED